MGSFLVIGMGRFGTAVAFELYRLKHDVLAVDKHDDIVATVVNHVTDVVIGDAKDETVLQSLGVQDFDCVVVAMSDIIEDSILITMTLKELGAKLVVCKAKNERHTKILSRIGADRIIHPELDTGKDLANTLARRNILDFLEISPEYGAMEMIAPKIWVDKSILKNNLRQKYGISIMAIRDPKTDEINFLPNANVILRKGDVLTMIGHKKDLDAISVLK